MEDDEEIESYIDKISRSGEWGGELEIRVL
jgi:hypothetical protein